MAEYLEQGFQYAKELYADLGVDVEQAMRSCACVPISMHCWQGDDVIGFEGGDSLDGGIAATGNYPGRAKNAEQLRADIDLAASLIPGKKRLSLHAHYADYEGPRVGRDELTAQQFRPWIDWASAAGFKLDFNATYFSHPMMDDNFSLASAKEGVRRYWIEHGKRAREIGEAFGKALDDTAVVNFWMPDGYKDIPADTRSPRERMLLALDEVFSGKIDEKYEKDAVESKLFGMGLESYTVGSHEMMYGYAITRGKLYCLDAGHFHPTEYISAKISAALLYLPEILLHVSRGVRWDSDHVVAFDDELQNIMLEIVRGGYLSRVKIALDYFDASINRIAAWVIGTRNAQAALLKALLEPAEILRQAEQDGDYTARLALMQRFRTLPFSAVWDEYCERQGVPVGADWLPAVRQYEKTTLSSR